MHYIMRELYPTLFTNTRRPVSLPRDTLNHKNASAFRKALRGVEIALLCNSSIRVSCPILRYRHSERLSMALVNLTLSMFSSFLPRLA